MLIVILCHRAAVTTKGGDLHRYLDQWLAHSGQCQPLEVVKLDQVKRVGKKKRGLYLQQTVQQKRVLESDPKFEFGHLPDFPEPVSSLRRG
jgi:hypothetical protein